MRNRKGRLNTLFKRIPWTEGMALTRSKKKTLDGGHSLGDGNCAFNAFALAFCRPDILDKVESQQEPGIAFKNFIEKVAEAFNIENNWQSVKQRLLELDKTTLQRKLAPILRKLAIEQAKCDNQNRDEMFHSLYSTYRHYIYRSAIKKVSEWMLKMNISITLYLVFVSSVILLEDPIPLVLERQITHECVRQPLLYPP